MTLQSGTFGTPTQLSLLCQETPLNLHSASDGERVVQSADRRESLASFRLRTGGLAITRRFNTSRLLVSKEGTSIGQNGVKGEGAPFDTANSGVAANGKERESIGDTEGRRVGRNAPLSGEGHSGDKSE